jgi:hypothetical protein
LSEAFILLLTLRTCGVLCFITFSFGSIFHERLLLDKLSAHVYDDIFFTVVMLVVTVPDFLIIPILAGFAAMGRVPVALASRTYVARFCRSESVSSRPAQRDVHIGSSVPTTHAGCLKDVPGPRPSLPFIGTNWQYWPVVGSFEKEQLHRVYDGSFAL